MKYATTIAAVLCAAVTARADWGTNALPMPVDQTVIHSPTTQAEFCQGADNETILSAHGIACTADQGLTVVENGHARRWVVDGDTVVQQVRFGVEVCRDNTGQGRPCAVEIRLYNAPSFPTFGSAVLLDSAMIDIPDGTAAQVFTADFDDVEVTDGMNLVVEMYNPATFNGQFGFFPGENNAGENDPTYIRAASCGAANWSNLDDLGNPPFTDKHFVLCWSNEGGQGGGCQYAVKKNSKPKKGCDVCPRRGDLYATGDACEDVKDCDKKIKIKQLDCPDGGPGFCKKIKGKRDSCL